MRVDILTSQGGLGQTGGEGEPTGEVSGWPVANHYSSLVVTHKSDYLAQVWYSKNTIYVTLVFLIEDKHIKGKNTAILLDDGHRR